ncbi:MAG: phenylalanine--tRNA ligase beta subunit-related protein [bacterium]|nr:phenylalanine--tRNA ligase beta subunit-related protein [bacterium]MDE0440176.1 phenylalanine--tRNA ligase beta subunit-related protein [bacterium]
MFSYHADVIERYPTIRAGVVHAVGLSNGPSPAPLKDEFQTQQFASRSALEDRTLSAVPSIAAWRRAFSSFGVKPTQYRNAAEALLRRLVKRGDVPSINLLVDIANLVAIRYALPVAAFDQAEVTGSTKVRLADGTERFTDLGSGRVVPPQPGEVVFVDQAGLVSARRWCWRQSRQSATSPRTSEALFTVEGQHNTAAEDVAAAANDIMLFLMRYQPDARLEVSLLSPENPRFGHG